MADKKRVMTAETLTGTRVLTAEEVNDYAIMSFDPGGAGRAITLPAIASNVGESIVIANTADAAEVLTISDSVGTVVTPTQAESAILWNDGVRWRGIAGANS
jgi:hypothetical protein